ncbi:MAG TPA: DUF4124 domain-containing protein [Steroidobacter sp.]|jgi:hypothetical protein|nr:DUF4124 domain-containing protein [Steroidobacteraceae bacterium]HLS82272.1 DUF4124 domain-containing protein [Steroidobacter sp.]
MLRSPFVAFPAAALLAAQALTLAFALHAPCATADVYKYTDEKGNVLYTDKPSTLPAERLNVQSRRTDLVDAQARSAADQERMQRNAQAFDDERAQRGEQRQAAQLSAQDKAERCAKARQRYDAYMSSQKLYEQLPNGERRYLSSEELDAARASAKASMDVMCQ